MTTATPTKSERIPFDSYETFMANRITYYAQANYPWEPKDQAYYSALYQLRYIEHEATQNAWDAFEAGKITAETRDALVKTCLDVYRQEANAVRKLYLDA